MNQHRAESHHYCFNPNCRSPRNPSDNPCCQSCGLPLALANRYRAIDILGQGCCSRTWLAMDQAVNLPISCVIKQVWHQPPKDTRRLLAAPSDRSQSLDQALEQVSHCPQLPRCLNQFEQDNKLYLVQEYIAGENLATVLARRGTFSTAEIGQILETLLPVIQQLHDCGIVHGDIKPENMIRRTATTSDSSCQRLDDLVLVDVYTRQPTIAAWATQLTPAIGSPAYAAPEQLQGHPIFASDFYSLGVTCIHLLTGIHPFNLFDAMNHDWVWRSYWLPDDKPTQDRWADLRLAELLDRLIAPDLDQRLSSARGVLTELQTIRGRQRYSVMTRSPKLSTWKCRATLTGHQGLFAKINAIAIAPQGQQLASASDDKTIRLWQLPTGQAQGTLLEHTHFVQTVAFHPQDPAQLASGSRDRTIKIWDLQTHQVSRTLSGHQQTVNAVLFSPDGSLLASGSADKQVKLWHATTGQLITSLKGHTLAVTALAFRPPTLDATIPPLLASASADASVCVWNLTTFELVHVLTEHTATVRAIAFSPNGSWLATAGDDRTIRLWNLTSPSQNRCLPGHAWSISGLSFSSDGEILISGSWDKTVKRWQVKTGIELDSLIGHTNSISCVAFSLDSTLIVSGSYDQTIKLWCC